MGAPTIFRTDLTEYLMDLLDFVEEKIKEAQNDHASRAGALSEAMGAFPIIKDRLYREDKKTLTQLLLIGFFDEDLMQLATLPNGEHASAVVALACHAHFDAIDRNGWAGAAHGLTWKRENALDKWYSSREVTAVLE